ncbi:MAG: hypothetical protein NT014_05960 [Candidatus Omnitrophica bacterium]|nr:hypothetical protein [Candidatus Omnitrophota bacterium]
MNNLKLSPKLSCEISSFIFSLKEIYGEGLLSVILYGSAASGEFVFSHSNVNILVVLKSTELSYLKPASKVIKRFKRLMPLFLSKEYILSSCDVFPIEFLDLQENYKVLEGNDILKEIHVDMKNLRFQCEQELKVKSLSLKQIYLNSYPQDLKGPLLKSFTGILHVLRNVLRLKGIQPHYQKDALIKQVAQNFKIDTVSWEKILAAKSNKIKLSKTQTEELFLVLVDNLDKITQDVDAL